jgi:FlaA1/EpsC-like NDP-sugar epimerase
MPDQTNTPSNAETAILIGTAAAVRSLRCQLFLHHLDGAPASGPALWPCGCILLDDDPKAAPDPGLPVLGTLADLPETHAWHRFTRALVTLPADRRDEADAIAASLRPLGVAARFIPTLDDLLEGDAPTPQNHIALPDASIDPAHLIGREPFPVDEAALTELIRGRRILITGAGGSIGSEIAPSSRRFGPSASSSWSAPRTPSSRSTAASRKPTRPLERASILHDVVDADGTDTPTSASTRPTSSSTPPPTSTCRSWKTIRRMP